MASLVLVVVSLIGEITLTNRRRSLQAQDTILNIYKSVITSNATFEVQYTQSGYKPVETGFKTGSWHNFGVVYYDKQGRSSSVQGKTSVYIQHI